MIEQIAQWLNDQSLKRPILIEQLMRVLHVIDDKTVPDDLFVYTSSNMQLTTDFLCIINSMFIETGKQITTVNIENTYQFIVVDTNEEMPTA